MASTKISKMIASGLGSGFAPVASGTFGSAAAIIVWYILTGLLHVPTSALIILFIVAGFWATRHELQSLTDDPDPSFVVIDEWAGMLIPLLIVAPNDPIRILYAFFLFRFFDVVKVPPAAQAERLPGALGVMLDDIIAGIYALLILFLTMRDYIVT